MVEAMGVSITYMGTKRALAPVVREVIGHAQPGTMLDAFAGMCSVGEAVGTARQIWSNDIQVFAAKVAKALLASRDSPLTAIECADAHWESFRAQQKLLSHSFQLSLAAEADLLGVTSFSAFKTAKRKLERELANDISKCRMRSQHLFSTTYSGTFFGIAQSIEADAICKAMEAGRSRAAVTSDQSRWCTIALGRSLLKISNSTGHFAQFLKPKSTSFRRHLALRKRSLWTEWLSSMAILMPIGDAEWRAKNRTFRQDSLSLIPRLAREGREISVIYADPPYRDDQYSRFYHVLETLCLYDYPQVSGAGLYRPERFQTPFSLKSQASKALSNLIRASARTGADLVLSYPTNGLANEAGADIRALLKAHFKHVEVSRSVAHNHSTFGASKGTAQSSATELVYLARSA